MISKEGSLYEWRRKATAWILSLLALMVFAIMDPDSTFRLIYIVLILIVLITVALGFYLNVRRSYYAFLDSWLGYQAADYQGLSGTYRLYSELRRSSVVGSAVGPLLFILLRAIIYPPNMTVDSVQVAVSAVALTMAMYSTAMMLYLEHKFDMEDLLEEEKQKNTLEPDDDDQEVDQDLWKDEDTELGSGTKALHHK